MIALWLWGTLLSLLFCIQKNALCFRRAADFSDSVCVCACVCVCVCVRVCVCVCVHRCVWWGVHMCIWTCFCVARCLWFMLWEYHWWMRKYGLILLRKFCVTLCFQSYLSIFPLVIFSKRIWCTCVFSISIQSKWLHSLMLVKHGSV